MIDLYASSRSHRRATIPNGRSVRSSRSAFTLIELMVVIGIIVILLAIMMPAIQAVRESARRTQCANNLRQIGIAANAYHAAHDRLPPGWLGATTDERRFHDLGQFQYVGSLAYLLPHLDGRGLFEQIKVDLNVRKVAPRWTKDESTRNAAKTRLSVFTCPSDTPYESEQVTIEFTTYGYKGQPKSNGRSQYSERAFARLGLTAIRESGRTNYVGMAGRFGSTGIERWDLYKGVFTNRSRTRLDHIKDGISRTIMFGEVYGEKRQDPPDGWPEFAQNYSWMGIGALPIVVAGANSDIHVGPLAGI